MTDRIAFAGTMTAEGRRIRGSVTLVGSRTFRNGEWLEVDPAALVKADASNVMALWDHDPGKVLGRSTNNTLKVNRTETGIEFETAELPDTTYANDALALFRGGYVTGSSFAIEGLRSEFSTDPDGTRVRRITSIKRLIDVSPVFDPAFTNSHAAAFSKEPTSVSNPEPIEEPKAPVVPAQEPKATEPKAQFNQVDETAEATERFARTLETAQIEQAMDAIVASAKGSLKGVALDQYEAYAKVYSERKRTEADTRERAERMEALHNIRLGRIPKAPADVELFASDDYKHAFSKYIRGDRGSLEQFAQSIAGTGAEGGYTVPEDFRQKIVESQAAFGGIQRHADVLVTGDGRPLPYPTNDDTANSAVVATEGAAPASAGADLVFGEISLGAFSIAATGTSNAPLKVSWELLQDSAFDIEGFVARKLGERLGRKSAAYYANGTGTTEPFGLLAKTPDTITATTMFEALVEHHFEIDEAYRSAGNARWIMSDTTLAKVYSSVDLNGRPLFIPAADASGAGRPAGILLGYPVQLDQAAADNVAFGDIRQGFVIRQVRGIQVVVDPYNNTATRQTAYHAWMRTDSAIQDSAAVSVADYSSVTADAVGS